MPFITGLGAGAKKRPIPVMILFMAAGTAALYAFGTAWFVLQTGNAVGAALGLCVLPFLPGDAAKIIAAALIAVPVRGALEKTAPSSRSSAP